jgi:PAS domain S-box-containing protein
MMRNDKEITKGKQVAVDAEKALRLYAQIVRTISDAVIATDTALHIVLWNDAAQRLYGWTEAEVLGKPALRVVPTELLACTLEQWKEQIMHDGFWQGTCYQTCKNGTRRLIQACTSLVHDTDGTLLGAVAVNRDLTEQAEAMRRLEVERALFDAVIQQLPEGVIIAQAPSGKMILGNEQTERIWGRPFIASPSAEEYTAYQGFHADGRPYESREWPLARAILYGEQTVDEEMVFQRGDGSRGIMRASAAPVRGPDGSIQAGVAIFADITAQRQLEQRTRQALETLLDIIQAVSGPSPAQETDLLHGRLPGPSLPDTEGACGVYSRPSGWLDRMRLLIQLTCHLLNCPCGAMLLLEPETTTISSLAVVGMPEQIEEAWRARVLGLNLQDWLTQHQSSLLEQLAAGESVVLDTTQPPYEALRYNQQVSQVLLIPLALGSCLFGLLALKRACLETALLSEERAAAQAITRLAVLVLDRLYLQEARDAARAQALAAQTVAQRMEEFIGIASHELKTPLTVITVNVQLLLLQLARLQATSGLQASADLLDPLQRMQGLTDRTMQQTQRLTRLVNDLVESTHLTFQHLPLRRVSCDLRPLVQATVEEERHLWPGRTITLLMSAAEALPIHADTDRIGQVLHNLLSNALKYSEPQQPVEVRVKQDGADVRVEVEDHGAGIAPQEQEYVWERFYRVDGSRVKNGSGIGLGLGLYICRQLIEQHGGQIGLSSVVEQGSTFWFTLPLAR